MRDHSLIILESVQFRYDLVLCRLKSVALEVQLGFLLAFRLRGTIFWLVCWLRVFSLRKILFLMMRSNY